MITRPQTALIGTPAAPASIAAGATATGTLDLTATAGTFDGVIAGDVIIASAPSAGPTVTYSYSLDGANFVADVVLTLPVTVATTQLPAYTPPSAAVQKVKIDVKNNDGAAVAITAWAQGNAIASSNL